MADVVNSENIFTIAVTACNIRANNIGLGVLQQGFINSLIAGFGVPTNGVTVYQQFKQNQTLGSTQGLGQGTLYDTYENNIYLFLNNLYPTVPANQLRNLALLVNGIMLGYSLYQSMTPYDLSNIIATTIFNAAQNINNNQIFTVSDFDGVIIYNQPFSSEVVTNLLNSNDYAAVLQSISQSPKNTEIQLANYNWYDTSSLFSNPNLQIMQDVENQYYFFSGELIYQSPLEELDDCVSRTILVNTPTGLIETQYIINLPCQQPNQLIAPIQGQIFNRIFNDGPYSSGDFNPEVKTGYMNFDYSQINTLDYSSNNEAIYSFVTGNTGQYLPLFQGNVLIDGQGAYSIPEEYTAAPAPYGCAGQYSLMHIGNNNRRLIGVYDVSGQCTGHYSSNATGFKFAALQLDTGTWASSFTYLRTNPLTSLNRYLIRALNTQDLSYSAVISGTSMTTKPYFGPPQFTGNSTLPTIAFFQNFQNVSYNQLGEIVFFAALGTSDGTAGADSPRTYSISSIPLFSGVQTGQFSFVGQSGFILPFTTTINSNYGHPNDEAIREFFGMGDGLTSFNSITAYVDQNAGYFYTGYVVESGGQLYDLISLMNSAGYNVIGSPASGITYVAGYTDGGNTYLQTKMIGQDPTGGLVPYYYLDNSVLPPDKQVDENNWTGSFAPLPTGFESDTGFNRVYQTQQVENFFPRYSRGPFATNEKTFLYPNAQGAVSQYQAYANGFPLTISFTLNIREEAVKELYGQYIISRDGFIDPVPIYTQVIRTTINGIDPDYHLPTMHTMFVPDNSSFDYALDFNNWAIGSDFAYNGGGVGGGKLFLVDNNWSPKVPNPLGGLNIVPSGKDNWIYNNDVSFIQGVKITGVGNQIYTIITGTGAADFYQVNAEQLSNEGLYHFYSTNQQTGALQYVLPIFDLSDGTINVNATIQSAFATMFGQNTGNCGLFTAFCGVPLNGANAYFINGSGTIMTTGQEPLFLQYVGGRSGSPLAVQEGGYHSSGIVGDLWNSFTYSDYGMTQTWCHADGAGGTVCNYPCQIQERYPTNDSRLILLNSTPNNTTIFTRALAFSPFVFPFSFNPWPSELELNYQVNTGALETLHLFKSGDFVTVDLNEIMPPVFMTGSGWYSESGITIGPFDRDVEIGVPSGFLLASSGDIYWNNNIIALSPLNSVSLACNQYYIQQNTLVSTGIVPSDNSGGGTRDPLFAIFGLVPSGQTANFNLSGYGSGILGLFDGATIAIRPRKTYGASLYDSQIHVGEQGWINPFMFLGNGLEQSYRINNGGGFENLANTWTFTNYVGSGKLYPQPANDFTGLATKDEFGNYVYPASATVEQYWKNYAINNSTTVIVSGWREGSRISFQFTDIELSWGGIPYQNQKIIIPTGQCTINGSMGYVAQADASIFSEGVILQYNTVYPQSGYNYTPYFVSQVLNRLPITFPSGNTFAPVLEAPSIMEQRQIVPVIQIGQKYNYLDSADPQNYNKFLWPALSDLETLNQGETIETLPADDGNTFLNSTAMFSASQGQLLPNGLRNPNILRIYDVLSAYQMYDSLATDALLNSGVAITTNRGTNVRLDQTMMSGAIAPKYCTISLIAAGLV